MKLVYKIILVCCVLTSTQQIFALPHWVTNIPKTEENDMYYFRVTLGEGKTYEKAYANAFAKAILESSWKLGLEVKTSDDLNSIQTNVYDSINVASSRMILPLNKVCEFVENASGSANKRVYILWQVAKFGNRPPNFKEFTNCR